MTLIEYTSSEARSVVNRCRSGPVATSFVEPRVAGGGANVNVTTSAIEL